jgi:hypothetical protein
MVASRAEFQETEAASVRGLGYGSSAAKRGSNVNVRMRQAETPNAETTPNRTKVARSLVANERNATTVVRVVARQGMPMSADALSRALSARPRGLAVPDSMDSAA